MFSSLQPALCTTAHNIAFDAQRCIERQSTPAYRYYYYNIVAFYMLWR